MNATRREFVKASAGVVAATFGVSGSTEEGFSLCAAPEGEAAQAALGIGEMIYRKFGSTGAKVSAIGIGGHHLGDVPTLDVLSHSEAQLQLQICIPVMESAALVARCKRL